MTRSNNHSNSQPLSILIAMAGSGRRFAERGFSKAKFKLIANRKPIFDWALLSFKNFYMQSDFVFSALAGDEEFIVKRCQILGIKNYDIVTLNNKTDGQATTVLLATKNLGLKNQLLIYNVDTHIDSNTLHPQDINPRCDGWMLLFKMPGEHWSFAKIDSKGRVVEIAEKKRISPFASVGLYYFRTVALFHKAYNFWGNKIKNMYGEIYVAPLYQYLISNNYPIDSKVISAIDVIPLGTPEEVLRFDRHFFKRYKISARTE